MNIIRDLGSSGNALVTLAFGGKYLDYWQSNAANNWKRYCDFHDLGLIVIDSPLCPDSDKNWKKAHWQKLLVGEFLSEKLPNINNICFLDSDILINPLSPNIFDNYNSSTIALTSLRKNLPYPYDDVLRRMAFLRHTHHDSKYPLDSALFISTADLYSYHNLPAMHDVACTGLIVFNASNPNAF